MSIYATLAVSLGRICGMGIFGLFVLDLPADPFEGHQVFICVPACTTEEVTRIED